MKFESANRKYNKMNDFIRGEMKRKKINQEAMAYRLNLSQQCVSYKLSGKVEWMAREIIIVFEMLGVDVNWNY